VLREPVCPMGDWTTAVWVAPDPTSAESPPS
jgi:hypothetical protein